MCYGQATSDEMCFGFLTYFPLQRTLRQPWCTSRRGLISCERTLPALWDRPISGCAWRQFIRPPSDEAVQIVTNVMVTCYSSQQLVCSSPCRTVLSKVRQHPCFVGDMGYYIVAKIRQYSEYGDAFARAWFTCNCDRDYDYCERRSGKGVMGRDKEALCEAGWTGAITDGTAGTARVVALLAVLVTCLCLVRGVTSVWVS